MSRLRLLLWLAGRDLRRRAAETVLLLTALTVAATTLTIGLLLHGQTAAPYATTRAATAGPDVVATVFAPEGTGSVPADPARLHSLSRRPGVTALSPPLPTTWTPITVGGVTGVAQVQGRPAGDSPVDRPRVVAGHWVSRSGDGVVLERAFAAAIGAHVGGTVTLGGRATPVAGIAVSAALPPYPQVCTIGCELGGPGWEPTQVGLVWGTPARVSALASAHAPVAYFQYLRLADPSTAPAFVDRYDSQSATGPFLESWQEIAGQQNRLLANERTVVVFGSTLLVVLALATLAVLVGGRMADEVRRVGTLKAAGATPGFVARLLLVAYLSVGLAGGLLGVAAGRLLAPGLVTPSAGLLGRLGPTSLRAADVLLVVGADLGVVVLAAAVPAWRAARTSTVRALADSGRAPHRGRLLLPISTRLPAPWMLGLRLVARRPRRALLSALAIGVSACGSYAALYAEAGLSADQGAAGGPVDPHVAQLHTVMYAVVLLLAVMSAVTLVFVTRASVVDSRRMLAVARTLGVSPNEAAAALGIAQLVPAVAGLVLGAIAGVVVFHQLSDGGVVRPALLQLAGLAGLTLLAVLALTAGPARLEARRPIAVTLHQS